MCIMGNIDCNVMLTGQVRKWNRYYLFWHSLLRKYYLVEVVSSCPTIGTIYSISFFLMFNNVGSVQQLVNVLNSGMKFSLEIDVRIKSVQDTCNCFFLHSSDIG